MRAALCAALLLGSFLLGSPSPAEDGEADARERPKRSPPYWGLRSSDFLGWMEELRAQAADGGMRELARIFWAHFPVGSQLGYDAPEPDAEG